MPIDILESLVDICRSKRSGMPLTGFGEEDTKRSANTIQGLGFQVCGKCSQTFVIIEHSQNFTRRSGRELRFNVHIYVGVLLPNRTR